MAIQHFLTPWPGFVLLQGYRINHMACNICPKMTSGSTSTNGAFPDLILIALSAAVDTVDHWSSFKSTPLASQIQKG